MMTLITGGSGSGKSAFAEALAVNTAQKADELVYLATMKADTAEGKRRIERHQRMRQGKGFQTVELPYDVSSGVHQWKNKQVLLECLSNLLANEWFDRGKSCEIILEELIDLNSQCSNLIIVTNEIFSDGIAYDEEAATYIRQLGWLNTRLAKQAEEVYEVVYGIPTAYSKDRSIRL